MIGVARDQDSSTLMREVKGRQGLCVRLDGWNRPGRSERVRERDEDAEDHEPGSTG